MLQLITVHDEEKPVSHSQSLSSAGQQPPSSSCWGLTEFRPSPLFPRLSVLRFQQAAIRQQIMTTPSVQDMALMHSTGTDVIANWSTSLKNNFMIALTAWSARNVTKISWAQRVSSFTLPTRLENPSATNVNNCDKHKTCQHEVWDNRCSWANKCS